MNDEATTEIAPRVMPLYRCTREVRALKLAAVHNTESGARVMVPASEDYGDIEVHPEDELYAQLPGVGFEPGYLVHTGERRLWMGKAAFEAKFVEVTGE